MLYEFRSRATGSVTMIGKAAEQVLKIIGKSPDATASSPWPRSRQPLPPWNRQPNASNRPPISHRTPMTRTFGKTPASASSACVSASIR